MTNNEKALELSNVANEFGKVIQGIEDEQTLNEVVKMAQLATVKAAIYHAAALFAIAGAIDNLAVVMEKNNGR